MKTINRKQEKALVTLSQYYRRREMALKDSDPYDEDYRQEHFKRVFTEALLKGIRRGYQLQDLDCFRPWKEKRARVERVRDTILSAPNLAAARERVLAMAA